MKKAIIILRKAYIYARRIDWLVSGDDGDNDFKERLKEELKELNEKIKNDWRNKKNNKSSNI